MNLQQFRFVHEAVRRKLNLTETARALNTSQPGVSKAILELEAELGIDIFARHGKRLRRVTEPGREVLRSIEIIVRELGNLRRLGDEHSLQDAGTLSLAATHAQARHVLPAAVAQMRKRFPKVRITLHQGTPEQVARRVADETADLGLATDALALHDELVSLPYDEWRHALVLPAGHPLAQRERITLQDLAPLPLLLPGPSDGGRERIDTAFAACGLVPDVVLEAGGADVIAAYVRIGLGIGIVDETALRDGLGTDLVGRPADALFGPEPRRIAWRRGAYLRNFVYAFAEILSERLTRKAIDAAVAGPP